MTRWHCPICGYPDLERPPRYSDGGASHEICPSCYFEFGYDDDDQHWTYEAWRRRWIEQGMPWSSRGFARPENWDPAVQLSAAD